MRSIKIITINLLLILLAGCASTNAPVSSLADEKLTIKNTESSGVSKKYEAIPQKLLDSANNGNAEMQFNIGLMFQRGRGVRQDHGEAIKWYEKAATQGLVPAQVNLGLMYYDGKGMEIDNILAAKWLEKAAAQGDDRAQYLLGIMYGKGEVGQRRDMKKSIELLTLSAKQNNKLATSLLIKLGLAAGVTPSITIVTAAESDAELCSAGIMESCFDLGNLYQRGEGGVKQDSKKAYEFKTKACDGGYKDACFSLGVLFQGGFGVKQDEKIARQFLLRFCDGEKVDTCMRVASLSVHAHTYTDALQVGDFEVAVSQLMYPISLSSVEKKKNLEKLIKKLKKIHAELGDVSRTDSTTTPLGDYGIYYVSMIPLEKHPSVSTSVSVPVTFSKAKKGGLYFKIGKIDGKQGIYEVEYWCYTCKNSLEGRGVRSFIPNKK